MLASWGSTITAAFRFLPEPLQREDLGVRRSAAHFPGRGFATESKMNTSNEWRFNRRSCEVSHPTETVNITPSSCAQVPSLIRFPFSLRMLTAIALAVCASLSGCSSSDAKQQKAQAAGPRAASVAVAKGQQQNVPVFLVGLGSVTAFYTANLKSRVDGQIMRVNFEEGQTVKQGDLLIVIDPRPFQVQLEQMQAQLFKDEATLRDAKLNLERFTTLIPSGSIAQQQVDTQKSLVDQLDGQVRTDQAQIDNAKLQLVYCNITAPFTGRVGLRQVDPGNIVHAADTN